MQTPIVTIITPTYNRAHVLENAIKSVLFQTYSNFEYLIVDDGSTDNTEALVTSFNDQRIRYIKCAENKGQSAAMNVGMEEAKGSYITFLDSDDEYVATRIEEQVKKFLNSELANLGIVTCGRIDIDSQGKQYYTWVPNLRGNLLNALITGKRISAGPPFLMFKREIIDNGIRFNETLKSVKELDFLIKIFLMGYSMDYVAIPLLKVHHGEGPRTFNYTNAVLARIHIYNTYEKVFTEKSINRKYLYRTFLYALFSKNFDLIRQVEVLLKNNDADLGIYAWSTIPYIKNKLLTNVYIKLLTRIFY